MKQIITNVEERIAQKKAINYCIEKTGIIPRLDLPEPDPDADRVTNGQYHHRDKSIHIRKDATAFVVLHEMGHREGHILYERTVNSVVILTIIVCLSIAIVAGYLYLTTHFTLFPLVIVPIMLLAYGIDKVWEQICTSEFYANQYTRKHLPDIGKQT